MPLWYEKSQNKLRFFLAGRETKNLKFLLHFSMLTISGVVWKLQWKWKYFVPVIVLGLTQELVTCLFLCIIIMICYHYTEHRTKIPEIVCVTLKKLLKVL